MVLCFLGCLFVICMTSHFSHVSCPGIQLVISVFLVLSEAKESIPMFILCFEGLFPYHIHLGWCLFPEVLELSSFHTCSPPVVILSPLQPFSPSCWFCAPGGEGTRVIHCSIGQWLLNCLMYWHICVACLCKKHACLGLLPKFIEMTLPLGF